MEDILKEELGTTKLKTFGSPASGCISKGSCYETDIGKIFVKMNDKPFAKVMFDGEVKGLDAIQATGAIKTPEPISVIDCTGGKFALVTEYHEMKPLHKFDAELGTQLANMHIHNQRLMDKAKKQQNRVTGEKVEYIDKFGFDDTTCCGHFEQNNTWMDNWEKFITAKIQSQVDQLVKEGWSRFTEREANELWEEIKRDKISSLFKDVEVFPALVHGDLWSGNVKETTEEPVIFDPAAFYGHNEYEFGIMQMFGKFADATYDEYHKIIPQKPGEDKRVLLYELFHTLNHWNHFGSTFRDSTITQMQLILGHKIFGFDM